MNWDPLSHFQNLRHLRLPEDWAWSSFRHYLGGDLGPVEIESHWTARKRELAGIFPTYGCGHPRKIPAQAELERAPVGRR
jgi:hypothetical protein